MRYSLQRHQSPHAQSIPDEINKIISMDYCVCPLSDTGILGKKLGSISAAPSSLVFVPPREETAGRVSGW